MTDVTSAFELAAREEVPTHNAYLIIIPLLADISAAACDPQQGAAVLRPAAENRVFLIKMARAVAWRLLIWRPAASRART